MVMREPAHPYTMGLMNASPDLERAGEALVPIEGTPPSLSEPPPGCRFASRCPFALAACSAAQPPMIDVATTHRAACLRTGEVAELRARAREASTWRR
jgi:peptide/nickel transport system ATP-binding protein